MRVGILALQGSVTEHAQALEKLGVQPVEVRRARDLKRLSGIILPGGESTAIMKLMDAFDLTEPLRQAIGSGMAAWGTCAGLILLAKEVMGGKPCLGLMDICAHRNAYGRQQDSFSVERTVEAFGEQPVRMVFIRAPWIERAGAQVERICEVDGRLTAAREKNILVTAFHPELTGQSAVHQYFLNMCE